MRARRAIARCAALAAVTALALAGTGCGVPTHTEVRVEGPPPEAGAPDFARPDPPPGPDDATSESQLINYFLRAAARDPDNAVEELRDFIHSDEQDGWQPDSQLYVVRAPQEDRVDTPGDPFRVNLTVRRVGQLTSNGLIEPRVQDEQDIELLVTTEHTTPADGQTDAAGGSQERFRIRNPPPFVLIDDEALGQFFEQRPLYFWDSDGRKLVPDLRWLPTAVPDLQRPQAVVEWLLAGPSPWLSGAAAPVPDGIELDGNVIWDDDTRKLKIPLTAPHDSDADLRKLDAQLWWTLRPEVADAPVEVVLVVDGEERRLDNSYRSSNPVPADPPPSFAVVAGEIRQYLPDEPVALPLDDEADQEVARAAATRDGQFAAVVVWEDSAGDQRLAVAGPAGFTETDLVAGTMGRPVWLDNPSGTGLVPAGGALYQFRVHEDGEVEVAPVELADLPTPVTAVAAAPDGRRLALVASGRLHVVSVTRAGGGVSVSRHQQLPTTATSLDGVAFLRENWLAVVGTARGQSRLYELTVDGAQEAELPGSDQVGAPASITSFVAYPADPADPAARGTIMFEADGRTYRYVHPSQPARIEAADLFGYEPNPDGEEPDPLAPFFLD